MLHKTGFTRYLIFILALSILLPAHISFAGSSTSIPPYINYEGRLTRSVDGIAVTETLDMTFTLYEDVAGQNALYTQNARVYIENGLFSVLLGEIPVEAFAEHSQVFVGVKVGNNPEMRPLQQIASVAYAYKAEVAKFAESAANVMGEVMVDSANNVGVGVANPSEKLDVAGNMKVNGDIYEGSSKLEDKYLGKEAQAIDANQIDGYHAATVADAVDAVPVIKPDVTYHNLRVGYAATAGAIEDNTIKGNLNLTDDTGSLAISINAANQEIKIGENMVWHQGNMGSSSGLDADLLDGLDSSQLIPPSPVKLHYQEFKTSGTWIRPEGVEVVKALLVGGGGGGGGRRGGGANGENSTLSSGATLTALGGGSGGLTVGGNGGGSYSNGAIYERQNGGVGVGSFGGVTGGGGGGSSGGNTYSGAGGECTGFGRGGSKGGYTNDIYIHSGGGGGGSYGAGGGGSTGSGSSADANTGGGGGGGGNGGAGGGVGGGGGGGGQIIFRDVPVTEDITITIGAGGAGGGSEGYVGGSGGSGYCVIMWYE